MRLHCFVVIQDGSVGVGFCRSWARRDKIVLEHRKAGHVAQMVRREHPYAQWLRKTVEYEETLDGQVILYGKVIEEGVR